MPRQMTSRDATVGTPEPRLELEILSRLDRMLDGCGDLGSILLDVEADRVRQRRCGAGLEPVDPGHLIRPDHLERIDDDPPMTDVRHLAGQRQSTVAALDLAMAFGALRLLARGQGPTP